MKDRSLSNEIYIIIPFGSNPPFRLINTFYQPLVFISLAVLLKRFAGKGVPNVRGVSCLARSLKPSSVV
jgi:hypothetical protein